MALVEEQAFDSSMLGKSGNLKAAPSNGNANSTSNTNNNTVKEKDGMIDQSVPMLTKGSLPKTANYATKTLLGRGSFGVVFIAKVVETGEVVAIKKVLQDKRYKNRELQLMKLADHRNMVKMRQYYYTTGDKEDETYLNLVLEYVPITAHTFIREHNSKKEHCPLLMVKLFMYQMCRAANYLHNCLGICHRDIKPQNLLVDPQIGVLKICDLGSAKQLLPSEPSVAYICSRYYRAPELILGATIYTTAIDMWSIGCVFGEFLTGQPMFAGSSSVDQLAEIMKILGSPTEADINAMNAKCSGFKFPSVTKRPYTKVFKSHVPAEAMDMADAMLKYSPSERASPLAICAHDFMDELRSPSCTHLANGNPVPPLFDWTEQEYKTIKKELLPRLVPSSSSSSSSESSMSEK